MHLSMWGCSNVEKTPSPSAAYCIARELSLKSTEPYMSSETASEHSESSTHHLKPHACL